MLRPGETFDRYVVEAILGEGGMGQVLRAKDTRLHRSVALKVVLPQSTGSGASGDAVARLLREARAAAALDHPNAIHVYDVGEHDGQAYIAMELVEGETLRKRMADAPWRTKLRWLLDVARALEAAHKLGIVHRDVKPDNVMIRSDGVVKVLDFGIARRARLEVDPTAATEAGHLATLTAKGAIVGTPAYMAPEQIRGKELDGRADQFAWGVMAYEVLTGRRPFADDDALALVASIVTSTPEAPSSSTPALPALVDAVVMRTLAKAPEERFSSMAEVITALEPLLAERATGDETMAAFSEGATVATPPSTTTPAKTGSKKLPFVAAAVALVAGVSAITALVHRPSRPSSALAVASTVAKSHGEPPSTCSDPTAAAALREGTHLFRTRSFGLAMRQLDRAIELDPGCAGANLRRLVVSVETTPTGGTRPFFAAAKEHRDRLSKSEAALLDAIAPLFEAPAQQDEAIRRLRALVKETPKDTDVRFVLGNVLEWRGDADGAIEQANAALAADAKFGPAYYLAMAVDRELRGDADAALKIAERCNDALGEIPLCTNARLDFLSFAGRCDEVERIARSWATKLPDHPAPASFLAGALAARNAPEDSVREALRGAFERLPKSDAKAESLWRSFGVDIRYGELGTALGRLREVEAERARTSTNVIVRYDLVEQEVELLLEMGKNAEAETVATTFAKKLDALEAPTLPAFGWMVTDLSIFADVLAYRAGKLPRADFLARRKAWTAKLFGQKPTRNDAKGRAWLFAFAGPAKDREDAELALAALSDFGPLPRSFDLDETALEELGKLYALAGRWDDALPLLEKRTRSCEVFGLGATRAEYWLGVAREAKGDREGAKKAFEVVVDRWGKAKPRSVTAEKAKTRGK